MFLGKTLLFHSASFHLGVNMGTSESSARGTSAMDKRPIKGTVEITSSRFKLRTPGYLS